MIRSESAHLEIAAQSHPGMTGKNNEDRYAVSAYRLRRGNLLPSVVAVLCDGIGGHRAGEVAAEIAVNGISHALAESNASQPVETLRAAVSAASQKIFEQANSENGRQGMGSTCACVWVIGKHLFTTSVGDSRIYLLRDNNLQQLTTDHTWVQEALEARLINPQQVHGHPNAHVIRRYLGSPTPPQCDFRLRLTPDETDEQALANQGTLLLPGDRLLLCSDGLTDLVSSAEISSALQNQSIPSLPQFLINLANERGGHDNITVVLLAVPTAAKSNPLKRIAGWFARRWWLFMIGIAAIGVLVLLGITIWLGLDFYANQNPITPKASATPVPLFSPMPPAEAPTTPNPAAGLTPQAGILTLQAGVTASPGGLTQPTNTPQPTAATLTPWPTTLLPTSTITSQTPAGSH